MGKFAREGLFTNSCYGCPYSELCIGAKKWVGMSGI
jgi:hypothetical protein